MPIDLPSHDSKPPYNRGNWVPVGWKPLVCSTETKKVLFAQIAQRKWEAHDKEARRAAAQKRKEEKKLARERSHQEFHASQYELDELKTKKEQLSQKKHDTFAKLKQVIQKESDLKKAEDERKRNNPLLAAEMAHQQHNVQSNSLISQQNLFNPAVFNHPSHLLGMGMSTEHLIAAARAHQEQHKQHASFVPQPSTSVQNAYVQIGVQNGEPANPSTSNPINRKRKNDPTDLPDFAPVGTNRYYQSLLEPKSKETHSQIGNVASRLPEKMPKI